MGADGSGKCGFGVPEPSVGPLYTSLEPSVLAPKFNPVAEITTAVPPMYGPVVFDAVQVSWYALVLIPCRTPS